MMSRTLDSVRIGIMGTGVLILWLAFVGCGGLYANGDHVGKYMVGPNGLPLRRTKIYPVKYVPNGVRTLARVRLVGGYVSFIGERYEFMGGQYFKLSTHAEEETGMHKLVSGGGGGFSAKVGEYETLTMRVQHECLDSHENLIAYGLLGNPNDTVTAEEDGIKRPLRKASIPANLQANGMLVYEVLGPGSTDIVTRTPGGRIIRSESYAAGEDSPVCH